MNDEMTADILRLAELIKDPWDLCGFLGMREKEVMVASTMHACRINLKEHGEAFSIRGDGVFSSSGGGLIDNNRAYRGLREGGLFREEQRTLPDRGQVAVILPTRLLVEQLKQHFKLDEYAA